MSRKPGRKKGQQAQERPGGGTRGRWSKYETSDLADSSLHHEYIEGTAEDLYSQAVDPATGNRLYTEEESLFLKACECFRTSHGRRFLRATDYLQILKALGYEAATPVTHATLKEYADQLEAEAPQVLSETDVREILTMHLAGATFQEIADRWGIQKSTAHHIVTGKLFRHVFDQFAFDILAQKEKDRESRCTGGNT